MRVGSSSSSSSSRSSSSSSSRSSSSRRRRSTMSSGGEEFREEPDVAEEEEDKGQHGGGHEGEDEDFLVSLDDRGLVSRHAPLLHGLLTVQIKQAADLPDTDNACFNIAKGDLTDPFVQVYIGPAKVYNTRYISNELNPVWDEEFTIPVCHFADYITFRVKDKEHIGGQDVGHVRFSVRELLDGSPRDGWFELTKGRARYHRGKIQLYLKYTPNSELFPSENKCVPDVYFRSHENCRVVLYQDADTQPSPIFEGLSTAAGDPYVPTRAWRDLYDALEAAKRFIYVTGWSVFPDVQLVRGDEDPDGASVVGELLKRKAADGVQVLVLLWDEKMSTDTMEGMMGTHDEYARRYFEGTGVECAVVPRTKGGQGVLAAQFVSTCYTHHQKAVVCDADPGFGAEDDDDQPRGVVAFVGGLDITNGRYDNPEFHLFGTLNTFHKGDFHSQCFPGLTSATGPREPWHDCHAMVQGPVVADIKQNFEERWSCQVNDRTDLLYDVDNVSLTFDLPFDADRSLGWPWTVQLFRSLSSDSAHLKDDRSKYLFSKGGRLVDDSIAHCMIRQIRNADHFIYMENQYFVGSAFSWEKDNDVDMYHLVPFEIAMRICDKIRSGQDFKVYIVVPMFPEGDPSSAAIQEILYWQHRTIEAMYLRVAHAIRDKGLDGERHPRDYLNFYCLGKRESPDQVPDFLQDPDPGTNAAVLRRTLRHPIYVHSKLSIFDDDYVLVGSANINQRSLGGNRDTEVAIGAYQPGFNLQDQSDSSPRGEIHTYRMALWAAHCGGARPEFLDPHTDECLTAVREVADNNWASYTAEEPVSSDVHLLTYPISVDAEGQVGALDPPFNCFPDTSAKVLGVRSGYLPMKLTT